MDDVGAFTKGSFDEHLVLLEKVLTKLEENNFTVNPSKCEWAVQETNFLGFWLTPTGVRPWKKKIQPILDLAPPKNPSEVRSFIGAVTFYRELFPKRSDLLSPLYRLTEAKNKNKFDLVKCSLACWGPIKLVLVLGFSQPI